MPYLLPKDCHEDVRFIYDAFGRNIRPAEDCAEALSKLNDRPFYVEKIAIEGPDGWDGYYQVVEGKRPKDGIIRTFFEEKPVCIRDDSLKDLYLFMDCRYTHWHKSSAPKIKEIYSTSYILNNIWIDVTIFNNGARKGKIFYPLFGTWYDGNSFVSKDFTYNDNKYHIALHKAEGQWRDHTFTLYVFNADDHIVGEINEDWEIEFGDIDLIKAALNVFCQ